MKKKEEAKEKEGGKNSVKQGGEKLEPRWKGRKNREIREGKNRELEKTEADLSVFFCDVFKLFKGQIFCFGGYGFPLVPLETKGSLPFRWKYCVCIYSGMQSGMFV